MESLNNRRKTVATNIEVLLKEADNKADNAEYQRNMTLFIKANAVRNTATKS